MCPWMNLLGWLICELGTSYPCLKKILPTILRWLAKETYKETSRKLKTFHIVLWRINNTLDLPTFLLHLERNKILLLLSRDCAKSYCLKSQRGWLRFGNKKWLIIVREVKFWNSLPREKLKFAAQESFEEYER